MLWSLPPDSRVGILTLDAPLPCLPPALGPLTFALSSVPGKLLCALAPEPLIKSNSSRHGVQCPWGGGEEAQRARRAAPPPHPAPPPSRCGRGGWTLLSGHVDMGKAESAFSTGWALGLVHHLSRDLSSRSYSLGAFPVPAQLLAHRWHLVNG